MIDLLTNFKILLIERQTYAKPIYSIEDLSNLMQEIVFKEISDQDIIDELSDLF